MTCVIIVIIILYRGDFLMKILVYGAWLMGSYLASELYNAKHQVTVLASGNRLNFLKDNGIVINHIIQKKKTVSKISITNEYKKNDVYDAVIVAMRRNHIHSILLKSYINRFTLEVSASPR